MTSYADRHVDVFCRGMDSAVWHKWFLNDKWSSWQSLGGRFLYEPVVITRKNYKIDVFNIGTDCALYYKNFNGKKWSDWIKLGGVCIGPPAVTSRDGTNILDIVVKGTDHAMYHKYCVGDPNKWYPSNEGYSRWGGEFIHDFSGCSWGNDHNSFFGIGVDGKCYEKRWSNDKSWQEFRALPGRWTGSPRSISISRGNIEVFGLAVDSSLNHVHTNSGQGWFTGVKLGGIFQSTPDVVSWGADRLDIFCVGMNSQIYHKSWASQGGWKDWYSLKGKFTHPCRAVSWGKNNISVFGIGLNYHLYLKYYKGEKKWGPNDDAWEDLQGVLSSMPGGRV